VGNGGNDRLYGQAGNDTVLGGAGNDIVNAGDGFNQLMDGGSGADKLYINGTNGDDRITVWDPDGNNAALGPTLVAAVTDPAQPPPPNRVLETDGAGYYASAYPFENLGLTPGATGVTTVLDGVNDGTAAINLGTDAFNFYGTAYTGASQLFVSDNGLITFGSGNASPANTDLTTSPSQAAIAPLWDDWTTAADSSANGDQVLAQFQDTNGDGINDRLVIEWHNVRRVGLSSTFTATFQAILQLNTGPGPGAITFNYVDTVVDGHTLVDVNGNGYDDGNNATVGIKDAGAAQFTRVLLINQNNQGQGAAFIRSMRAIRIGPDPGLGQTTTVNNVDSSDTLLVNGGPGNDYLQLENPNITQSRVRLNAIEVGGPGNDTLIDGLGQDTLYGGSAATPLATDGNDVLMSTDGTPGDVLYAGGGQSVDFTPEIGDTAIGFHPVWAPLGPAPIINGQSWGNSLSGDAVSGRITSIAPDPTSPNILYVGAATGGVWKTTDGGFTWTPLTDGQASLVIGAIAVAPQKPNVIYAATGEANNAGDSFPGQGVLKSTDGGQTWTLFPGATAGNATANVFFREFISKVVIDPTDATANTVYVTVGGAGTNQLVGTSGVWRTTDGGATWTNLATADSFPTVNFFNDQFSDLVIDPSSSSTLYTAVWAPFNGSSGAGVYKTTNGGSTWSRLTNIPTGSVVGRTALAISATPSSNLYVAMAGTGQPGSTGYGQLFRFLRSTDGGANFTDLTAGTPNYLGSGGNYDTALLVDPANALTVYAGGSYSNFNGNSLINAVIKSTNQGGTWADISAGADLRGPHSDVHALALDAAGRLLIGTDGGLWRLDNAAAGSLRWTDLNTNLNTIQFVGIAIHPTNPHVAAGGSQDNGTEQFSDSARWTWRQGGDGGFTGIDPGSSSNGTFTLYQEFQASGGSTAGSNFLQRSTDGGVTYTSITSNFIGAGDTSNFFIPYVFDAAHSGTSPGTGRLLLGTNRVYESTDSGATWTAKSTPGANGWSGATGDTIDSLAAAPSDANTVYAAANGHLYVSTNFTGATPTWAQRDPIPSPAFPFLFIEYKDIVVDPTNAQVVYVTVASYGNMTGVAGGGQVWRSADGGATWTNLNGNLTDLPAWTIALDPRGPGSADDVLYLGRDDGVYTLTNPTAASPTWTRFSTGLPNVQVRQLELSTQLKVLVAGTYGRGVWEVYLG
jgi:hypothetical protein